MSYEEKRLSQLLRDIKDKDGVTRSKAISELGELKVKEVIASILDILRNDRDALVRSAAASALGTLREDTKEAIETLIETIEKDRVLGVRLEATMALGNIKSRTALPALTKIASENNNALLRSWVIDAIRKIQK